MRIPKITMVLILLSIITISFCARKAPPLSIDRIDPKLNKIQTINEHHLILYFSEELDTTKVFSENFTIIGGNETLNIIDLCPGNSPAELFIFTERMKDTIYEIFGKVVDKSKREGIFKKQFKGISKPDTIAPWIKDFNKGNKNNFFFLSFSEPVDTNSLRFFILPRKNLFPNWQNLHHVEFRPQTESDSLCFDTTYYLYLKEIADLSGNKFGPFVNSITPDLMYHPFFLKGKVFIGDTLLKKDGIAILKREYPVGITLVRNGEFDFEVRDSSKFLLEVITPQYYGFDSVAVGQENIIRLNTGAVELDSIID